MTDIKAVSGIVGQLRLQPGMNEITAALKLIKETKLEGAVVTGEAIFCQKMVSQAVLPAGGARLFPVKDHQSELEVDLEIALASPFSPRRGASPTA